MKLRKWLICLLGVLLVVTLCVAVACNNITPNTPDDSTPPAGEDQSHLHTFSDEWTSNEIYHWQAATCKHANEIRNVATHTFDDGICTVCGYRQAIVEHSHTYSNQWTSNEIYHWNAATCKHTNEINNLATHSFANGICTVCQYKQETNSTEPPTSHKQVYDMSGVVFENMTFTYDGYPHSIEISGKLPDGVSVAYVGNDYISMGSYVVVAKFFGDTGNYEPIPDKTAILTIIENNYCLTYTLNSDGTYAVTGYDGSRPTVTIPAFFNYLPVTSIANSAFSGCSSLESITIPASITSIDKGEFIYRRGAFGYCSNLQTVTFESGSQLEIIGRYVFYGCSNLTSITIPDNVTLIDYYAFESCSSLESITFPASVTSIGDAFYGCTSLQYAYFSNPTGWKCDDRLFSTAELSDPTQAALYLRQYGSIWTRQD